MDQGPSWAAINHKDSQDIPCLLQNPKVSRIWGFHIGVSKDGCLLGSCAM